MGTTDNIFVLNNIITHCLNKKERLYCALVDFTKAIDFVVRDRLWFKLIKLGIWGIIKSIYNSVNQESNTIILLVTFSPAILESDKVSVCLFFFLGCM